MSDTGNPIFDFRAGFRVTAAAAQRWLTRLGLIVAALSVIAWIVGRVGTLTSERAWIGVLSGVALVLSGVAWGYYWRWKLREDFRKTYGPKA
ncbi:MAG: hypothetical protein KIS92_08860 [Planctomycetota bacterium]|nr:hypothetical protein [Planctomycetota bacterium]